MVVGGGERMKEDWCGDLVVKVEEKEMGCVGRSREKKGDEEKERGERVRASTLVHRFSL